MLVNEIKTIGVCGAGTMGLGIAQVFAQNGFTVKLYDIAESSLQQAIATISQNLATAVSKGKLTESEKTTALNNISTSTVAIAADFIIEAVVENLAVKKDLFAALAAVNSESTILATNTSSLSVSLIAKDIPNPARVVGVHFFNPAHLMKLVEVISGIATCENTQQTVVALIEKIGKTPVVCKDSPGFIVNRVARHFYVESLKIAEERVATIPQIDRLIESMGFKMGPFTLMDTIGNDINFAVTKSLFDAFHGEPRFRPPRLQQQKVDAGQFGKKTGQGFYQY